MGRVEKDDVMLNEEINAELLKYVGMYVCYTAMDGSACWGRIKEVVKINTMKGQKDAFILAERVQKYKRPADMSKFFATPEEEKFFEVREMKGDTVIRVDVILLERDVIDVSDLVKKASTNDLFLALLAGKKDGYEGKTAIEIGLNNVASTQGFIDLAKQEIKARKSTDGT